MDVLHEPLVFFDVRKDNDCRFYTLVYEALAIRWWEHNNARIAFAWESVNAVVIVLVEHPEFVLRNELSLSEALLTADH